MPSIKCFFESLIIAGSLIVSVLFIKDMLEEYLESRIRRYCNKHYANEYEAQVIRANIYNEINALKEKINALHPKK